MEFKHPLHFPAIAKRARSHQDRVGKPKSAYLHFQLDGLCRSQSTGLVCRAGNLVVSPLKGVYVGFPFILPPGFPFPSQKSLA